VSFFLAQDPRSFLILIRIRVFKSLRVVQSFCGIPEIDIVLAEIAPGLVPVPLIFHLSAPTLRISLSVLAR
jgi:hypothetical protein